MNKYFLALSLFFSSFSIAYADSLVIRAEVTDLKIHRSINSAIAIPSGLATRNFANHDNYSIVLGVVENVPHEHAQKISTHIHQYLMSVFNLNLKSIPFKVKGATLLSHSVRGPGRTNPVVLSAVNSEQLKQINRLLNTYVNNYPDTQMRLSRATSPEMYFPHVSMKTPHSLNQDDLNRTVVEIEELLRRDQQSFTIYFNGYSAATQF